MADSRRGLDPNTGLVGRTFERKTGCWSCKHYDRELAIKYWRGRRQQDLQIALAAALTSPMGEKDPKVVNIRRMIDAIDHGLAAGTLGKCFGGGIDANDNPVGDFVKAVYLCRKWSGAQGASVAHAGEGVDPLPMELEDKTS